MEHLLRDRARQDQGSPLAKILGAVGETAQALRSTFGAPSTSDKFKEMTGLSLDSAITLKKIQGTLRDNWSEAVNSPISLNAAKSNRWASSVPRQIMTVHNQGSRRHQASNAPVLGEEIRGLDDLFPSPINSFFQESKPEVKKQAIYQDNPMRRPDKPSRQPYAAAESRFEKPICDEGSLVLASAGPKEKRAEISPEIKTYPKRFDASLLRKVRWPDTGLPAVNVPEVSETATASVAESTVPTMDMPNPQTESQLSEMTDTQPEMAAIEATIQAAELQIATGDLLLAEAELYLSADDMPAPGESTQLLMMDVPMAELCADSGETDIQAPEAFELSMLEADGTQLLFEHAESTVDLVAEMPTCPIVMQPEAESDWFCMTEDAIEDDATSIAHYDWFTDVIDDDKESVTGSLTMDSSRYAVISGDTIPVAESDYLRPEGSPDIILASNPPVELPAPVSAQKTPVVRERLQLEEELAADLSSFDYMLRNNKILSHSISSLVDSYFYKTSQDEEETYY